MERLPRAMNAHDLDALLDCFAEEYRSTFPVHPDRAFIGREQVRKNWSSIFAGLPDFRAELVRQVAEAGLEWGEWRWWGARPDGGRVDMRGVIIAGVETGRIAWGRLYMEHLEQGGAGIDGAVRHMTAGDPI